MTLRDIGDWFQGTVLKLSQDWDIVLSEPIVDWPLYVFPLAFVALSFAYGILMLVLSPFFFVAERWKAFLINHFDSDGEPTTRLGRILTCFWDGLSITSSLLLLWLIVAMASIGIVTWLKLENIEGWVVFGLPSTVCFAALFLLIRGRRAKHLKESSKSFF